MSIIFETVRPVNYLHVTHDNIKVQSISVSDPNIFGTGMDHWLLNKKIHIVIYLYENKHSYCNILT